MVFHTHRLDSAVEAGTPAVLTPCAARRVREPLRICMMVTYDLAAPCGGVKHHAQQLAAALRRNGDEVTIVGSGIRPGQGRAHQDVLAA